MLRKILPLFFLLTSCQAFGIKESDTIHEAEMKVVHVIETKAGIIAETPAPDVTQPVAAPVKY